MTSRNFTRSAAALFIVLLAGCSGGTGNSLAASAPTPPGRIFTDLTWTASFVSASQSGPISFPDLSSVATLYVNEMLAGAQFGAPYTASIAPHCANATQGSTNRTFTITPVSSGNCLITIRDKDGNSATLGVTVPTANT